MAADRLKTAAPQAAMLARAGDDAFALILPDIYTAAQAQLLITLLARPFLIEGQAIAITASLGLVPYSEDGRVGHELLRQAERAVAYAKAAGGSQVGVFDAARGEQVRKQELLEQELRRALPLGQLGLAYQPQVDLRTGRVAGFEALLRWHHPTRGSISPAIFIPVAESCGLIGQIGAWCLRKACAAAVAWPDDVSVAVNVSAHQFGTRVDLADLVMQILTATGLAPSRLEIEITESALMHNPAAVVATLNRLREAGIRVAMDDFGTGYSSLSQLHSFPFDTLKIDRAFVAERSDSAGQTAILQAIIAMGQALGMHTLAEGAETADQISRIAALGCDHVQGYYYSKPISGDEVNATIHRIAATPMSF